MKANASGRQSRPAPAAAASSQSFSACARFAAWSPVLLSWPTATRGSVAASRSRHRCASCSVLQGSRPCQ